VGPLAYIDPNTASGMSGDYGASGASKTVDPLDPVIEEEEEKPKRRPPRRRPNNLLREGSMPYPPEEMTPVEGSGYPGSGYPGGPEGTLSNVAGPIHPEANRGYRPSSG